DEGTDRAACVLHVAGQCHQHCITKVGARPWIILKGSSQTRSAKGQNEQMFFGFAAGTAATKEGRGRSYGFGVVRVAALALLIFTALSGWRSCGVVITKFSDHVVTFRSSPTFFADTPGACVRFNPHFGWQAAESYVERSNAFALISGHRVLADL